MAITIRFEQQVKACLDLVVVEADSVEAGVPVAAGVVAAEAEAVVAVVGVEVVTPMAAVPVDEEEVEEITPNL